MVWTWIRSDKMSDLIWVHTVYNQVHTNFCSCSPLLHCACKLYMLKRWGDLFPGSECSIVIQISMRMQIIVGIWVLVSMMPGKREHETGIFATFTGKAVRLRGVTNKNTKWNISYCRKKMWLWIEGTYTLASSVQEVPVRFKWNDL